MDGFITAITGEGGISASALWGAVTAVAGVIVIGVLFAFGYRMVRRVLNGLSKGKQKM